MAGKILYHLGRALCVPPRSPLTVCAVALLRIRELGRIRHYSPRERKREREGGVKGKREEKRERDYVEGECRMHLISQTHMAGLVGV